VAGVGIRRKVSEPEIWTKRKEQARLAELFRPPLGKRTLVATSLATAVLFAYWGLFTWLPGFLSAPAAEGGAGLGIVRTSGWVFTMQIGALAGYLAFGFLADRIGRRPAFLIYVVGAAIVTPVYGGLPQWAGGSAEMALLVLGPAVGFLGTGYFSLFGALLAELFPTALRGAGQGLCYNSGRALSAFAPYAVGAIADRRGIGSALALNSGFFLLAAVLIFALPETRSVHLDDAGAEKRSASR
jgi:MFS family permease